MQHFLYLLSLFYVFLNLYLPTECLIAAQMIVCISYWHSYTQSHMRLMISSIAPWLSVTREGFRLREARNRWLSERRDAWWAREVFKLCPVCCTWITMHRLFLHIHTPALHWQFHREELQFTLIHIHSISSGLSEKQQEPLRSSGSRD